MKRGLGHLLPWERQRMSATERRLKIDVRVSRAVLVPGYQVWACVSAAGARGRYGGSKGLPVLGKASRCVHLVKSSRKQAVGAALEALGARLRGAR